MATSPAQNTKRTLLITISGTLLAAASALVASFCVRAHPLARAETLKRDRNKKEIVLFEIREGENPERICSGRKAKTVISLGVRVAEPLKGAYTVHEFFLTGDSHQDMDALAALVDVAQKRESLPVVLLYRRERPEFAAFLAAYRVIHDGWLVNDAIEEAHIRSQRKSFPKEVKSVFDKLRTG